MTIKKFPNAEKDCAGEALFCSLHQNPECQSKTKLVFEFELFRFWNPNFSPTVGLVASTKTSLQKLDFKRR